MKNSNGLIKKSLLIVFLVGVSLPAILFVFSVKKRPLHHIHLVSDFESPSTNSWASSGFQTSFSKYMHDNLGLLAFFINLRNQIDYSFFNVGHTEGIVCGKDNYLFESVYIDAATGDDFMGQDVVAMEAGKIKELQTKLEENNKYFLFCLATGKGSYYPEYIPYTYEKNQTNHDAYVDEFRKQKVNHIDCVPWFLEMKDSLGHLLFPQYGIHWSYYSSLLVADSLTRHISEVNNWGFPELIINEGEYSHEPKYRDYDIGIAMNLFNRVEMDNPLFYPTHTWNGVAKEKKSLLIIGDSYTTDIFRHSGIEKSCFDTVSFWYYNQSVFLKKEKEGLPILTRQLDLYKTLNSYDAFMILSNEPNLTSIGWKFVDDALAALEDSTYKPMKKDDFALRSVLKVNYKWKNELKKRALERGVSIEEMTEIYLSGEGN